MIPLIATIGTAVASVLMIRLDRVQARISKAVWLPFLWLSIASSRPVSNWLTFGAPVSNGSSQYIDGSPLDRNVLLCLVLLAVVALSRRKRRVGLIVRANMPLLLFLGYCAVSVLWAEYPFVLLKRWIRAVADVAMVCIILTEAHPAEAFKRVLTLVGALLLPLSILFTRFFPSLGRSYTYGGAPMWTGVATDKNALGALCMLVGLVFLSRGLALYSQHGDRRRRRRLMIIGTLFTMAVYLLTMIDSKTALVCFVMASALIILRGYGPRVLRRPSLLTTAMILMVGTVYSVLFMGLGSSTLSSMGRDTSLTGRTQVWDIVIPYAVNPLIGAGYENFWIGERLEVISRAIGAGLNQAHNGYIEIYLNIGWVGLGLLALVIVTGYRNIIRSLRVGPEMSGLKLAFFFICIVYNFTEAAFKIMSPVWIMFLWAILVVPKAHVAAAPRFRNLASEARMKGGNRAEPDAWLPPTPAVLKG